MARPLLFALAALCCLAAAAHAAKPAQDIIVGTCRPNDKLLHVETVRKSSKWMQIRIALVEYPVSGQQGSIVSCVRMQSLKTGDYQGTATLQRGGPGQREAVVRVKSDRGHSVSWNVLIYGPQ